jgi:hypothetical protein
MLHSFGWAKYGQVFFGKIWMINTFKNAFDGKVSLG